MSSRIQISPLSFVRNASSNELEYSNSQKVNILKLVTQIKACFYL